MKTRFTIIAVLSLLKIGIALGQDDAPQNDYQIKTIFRSGHHASGGYGAIGNKFTTINGEFANLAEVYGGWYINHKFLFGIGAAAVTNNIPVPEENSTMPGTSMSYEYGQAGLMMEYTLWSHRAIHLSFQLFNGGAFTVQYMRYRWDNDEFWNYPNEHHDTNFFFVTEPGVKVEMNIFRWMRFCPGVSYRAAVGSNAFGLTDSKLSGTTMNLTLKFGKF